MLNISNIVFALFFFAGGGRRPPVSGRDGTAAGEDDPWRCRFEPAGSGSPVGAASRVVARSIRFNAGARHETGKGSGGQGSRIRHAGKGKRGVKSRKYLTFPAKNSLNDTFLQENEKKRKLCCCRFQKLAIFAATKS